MTPSLSRREFAALAGVTGLGALLTACAPSGDPFGTASAAPSGGEIVVGSQQYYSNEIIAECYAQALEASGRTVRRQFQIGQREVYLAELEAGRVGLIPEYSGNLLQYYDSASAAHSAEEVTSALATTLPSGLRVLAAAAASDQDSYTVTSAFATEHGLSSIADLAKAGTPLRIAANSEFATRPYGPDGAKRVYGVDGIEVVPVEDSGGPLTLKALVDGQVEIADLYTADPSIASNALVVLADPESLILPQQVVPLAGAAIDDAAAAVIDRVQAALDEPALRGMNGRSVNDQLGAPAIATEWLTSAGLV